MYGGILYYLDASGFSPTQLEWNMKLWWPLAETLTCIALLMAYKETREQRFIEKFDLVFQCTSRAGKSHVISYLYRFRKTPFLKCFPSTLKPKQAFSNSSGLRSDFEKLRFRDELVWTVGIIVERNRGRKCLKKLWCCFDGKP